MIAVKLWIMASGVVESSTDYLLNTQLECDALIAQLERKIANHYDLGAPYAMRLVNDRRIIFYGDEGNLWEAVISIAPRDSEQEEVAYARGTNS